MKKETIKKIVFPLVILSVCSLTASAQGCSDAGVCTIHSILDNIAGTTLIAKKKNEISTGFQFGIGERSINYYTPYLEYTRTLGQRTSLTGKFSYAFIQGELTDISGPADIVVSVSHVFSKEAKWEKSFIAGVKLPLNNAGRQREGILLPMPYQTSLGTTDLLLGLNYKRKSFGATLAWQQPLQAGNKNGFLPGDYPAEPLTLNYWPSNNFQRKGDLVGRVSWNFQADKKFAVRPGLLGIYHLGNDTYLDRMKIRRYIYNSAGLTLNGTLFLHYTQKNGNSFELSAGTPFIVRDQRPDGLTRKFVAGLEYRFRF